MPLYVSELSGIGMKTEKGNYLQADGYVQTKNPEMAAWG